MCASESKATLTSFSTVLLENPSLKLWDITRDEEKTHWQVTIKSSLRVPHGCCASCSHFTSLNSSLTEKLTFASTGFPCYYLHHQTSCTIGDFLYSAWRTHIPCWHNLGYHFVNVFDRSRQWYTGAIQVTVLLAWLWAGQHGLFPSGRVMFLQSGSILLVHFLPPSITDLRSHHPSPSSVHLDKL